MRNIILEKMGQTHITELIGNTPIIKLKNISKDSFSQIWVKLENYNFGGSIKDRIALGMLIDAENKGILKPNMNIIEPSTGNTGISLAILCNLRGYNCTIVMPKSSHIERFFYLKSLGAEIILTREEDGIRGAINKAREIANTKPNTIILNQIYNKVNVETHRKTTAQEIIQATDGELDAFVSVIGTGGTITGVGEELKKINRNIKIIGVEPASSAVLSGGKPGKHKIPGIGLGFIPPLLNLNIIDEIVTVKDIEAYHMAMILAKKEGIFSGISAGANVFAALKVSEKLGKNKKIITLIPDSGERYYSIYQYYHI